MGDYGLNQDAGLPSLLLSAAHAAAQADGLEENPTTAGGFAKQQNLGLDHALAAASSASANRKSGGGGKKKGPPLRRGKWTPEEEAYANRLIQEFKAGLLPLTDGTTLRTFLSKLLNCDPMRISKKFVGSNCIGKQVFRRRTADINRLTPEQIQQSRAELSELERRFLERVAQTNRVKSASGVSSNSAAAAAAAAAAASAARESVLGNAGSLHHHGLHHHHHHHHHQQQQKPKEEHNFDMNPPSPPWLQTPMGYKPGAGAAMAASNLSGGESNSRAAAAGRALLQGLNSGGGNNMNKSRKQQQQQQHHHHHQQQQQHHHQSNDPLASHGSAGLLAMAELQRRASHSNFFQNGFGGASASDILGAAMAARGGSNSALADIARNASAARLAAAGGSMNSLMMKTGLSRDQLNQLANDKGLSSASLSNMMERQNSFDALMSLDFQSLQSIDNLANLIQTGGAGSIPEGGMKNWSAESRTNLAAAAAAGAGSSGNLTNAARRLASAGRMESLLRSLSSAGNLGSKTGTTKNDAEGNTSNSNFSSLLQSMQSNLNNLGNSGSARDLLNSSGNGNGRDNEAGGDGMNNMASAVSLANLLRPTDSSTGLTALRMQEGLNQRNSSVDDFLSLVAAGDIPHQDPSLLNVPLMQQQNPSVPNNPEVAAFLAQRQLLARAAQSRSFQNLGGSASRENMSSSAAAFAAMARERGNDGATSQQLKRKLLDLDGTFDAQGSSKR